MRLIATPKRKALTVRIITSTHVLGEAKRFLQRFVERSRGFFCVPIAVARADEADPVSLSVDGFHGNPYITFVLTIGGHDFSRDGVELCPFFRFHLHDVDVEVLLLSLAGSQRR